MGRFLWNTTTGQWTWDAGMYELHGYRPGAVAVSTELVLEHKQDEDRARAEDLLAAAASGDQEFSNYHSIVDARGRRRSVVTVGESRADPTRPTVCYRFSRGFMVDVTQDVRESNRRAVEAARRGSAPIQQSLGLLMGSLGLTEDAAFELMVRVANDHNVKVRALARRFMAIAVSGGSSSPQDLTGLLVSQAAAQATGAADVGGAAPSAGE